MSQAYDAVAAGASGEFQFKDFARSSDEDDAVVPTGPGGTYTIAQLKDIVVMCGEVADLPARYGTKNWAKRRRVSRRAYSSMWTALPEDFKAHLENHGTAEADSADATMAAIAACAPTYPGLAGAGAFRPSLARSAVLECSGASPEERLAALAAESGQVPAQSAATLLELCSLAGVPQPDGTGVEALRAAWLEVLVRKCKELKALGTQAEAPAGAAPITGGGAGGVGHAACEACDLVAAPTKREGWPQGTHACATCADKFCDHYGQLVDPATKPEAFEGVVLVAFADNTRLRRQLGLAPAALETEVPPAGAGAPSLAERVTAAVTKQLLVASEAAEQARLGRILKVGAANVHDPLKDPPLQKQTREQREEDGMRMQELQLRRLKRVLGNKLTGDVQSTIQGMENNIASARSRLRMGMDPKFGWKKHGELQDALHVREAYCDPTDTPEEAKVRLEFCAKALEGGTKQKPASAPAGGAAGLSKKQRQQAAKAKREATAAAQGASPMKKPKQGNGAGGKKGKKKTCFACGEKGHLSWDSRCQMLGTPKSEWKALPAA